MLIHSIFLRRLLVGMSIDLDKKEVSPSDFAVVVRNLPKNMSKESLKAIITQRFAKQNVEVVYVNLCYNIREMVRYDKIIKDLSK